jgi:hypothetical protein
MGKPERKRPLGGPRRKWEDNIKMFWTEFIWLRIGTSGGLHRNELSVFIKCWEILQ